MRPSLLLPTFQELSLKSPVPKNVQSSSAVFQNRRDSQACAAAIRSCLKQSQPGLPGKSPPSIPFGVDGRPPNSTASPTPSKEEQKLFTQKKGSNKRKRKSASTLPRQKG